MTSVLETLQSLRAASEVPELESPMIFVQWADGEEIIRTLKQKRYLLDRSARICEEIADCSHRRPEGMRELLTVWQAEEFISMYPGRDWDDLDTLAHEFWEYIHYCT